MEKEKLTLENFNEKLALELLKEENFDSDIIKVDWDYEEGLEERNFEQINKIKWENNIDDYKTAVHHYLEDYCSVGILEEINEKEMYLVNTVLRKYTDYEEDSDEYEKMSEKIYEVVIDNFKSDYAVDDLLSYSDVDELTVFLDNKEKGVTLEDELDRTEVFNDYERLEEDLTEKRNFNPITFLIQSQGYELEDFYDDKKIKNSVFLTSLKEELEEIDGGAVYFSKIGSNALEVLELQESEKNIVIPKDVYVGVFNYCNGSGTCGIELEKEIILNRKDALILSDFNNDTNMYLIQDTFGLIDTKNNVVFEETDEKGFEMHDVNVEKVLEKAKVALEYESEKEDEYEFE